MAVVRIAPWTGPPNLDVPTLAWLLRQHASDSEELEHLTIRTGDECILIFGFLMADSSPRAREDLNRIVRRALAAEWDLRHYRVL